MPSVRIRGSYASALTRVFLDHDYTIAKPSSLIQTRFASHAAQFDTNIGAPRDFEVEDRYDKEGVVVTIVNPESYDAATFPLNSQNFPELVFYRPHFQKDAIFLAEVVKNDYRKRSSLLLLEETDDNPRRDAFQPAPVAIIDENLKVGRKVLVQVELPSYFKHKAKVSTNVTLSNDFLVLIKNSNRILISKKLGDRATRDALKALGREENLPYGIIFRTAAASVDETTLKDAITSLKARMDRVVAREKATSDVARVYEGKHTLEILFPLPVKHQLDEMREQVIPTIPNHHSWKACARDFRLEGYSRAVDYCEALVQELPDNRELLQEMLEGRVFSEFVRVGNTLRIEHQKLDGRKFYLTPGTVQEVQRVAGMPKALRVFRKFSPGGYLDGLNLPKEYGDYALGQYTFGEWSVETTYYNEHDELKGKYFNINTPVELRLEGVYYVDLEIDVVEHLDGTREIIDKDKLEKAYLLGIISEPIYKKAKDIAKSLVAA